MDKTILKQKTEEINNIIYKYLPVKEGYNAHLTDAMNYSMKAGGKRIRPMLISEFYDLFTAKDTCDNDIKSVVYPFMAALEMIHTSSLVHDDLPAIDNDDYRRGELTTHKKYGESMGVLSGDALLNYAYETALKAFETKGADKDKIIRALRVLSEKSGINGMLGGQATDVYYDSGFSDESTLMYVYKNKTAALIEAGIMIGAILGGADEERIEKCELIGEKTGIAFQIRDDYLDVYGDEKKIGKPLHSDEKNNKTTYVSIHGSDKANEYVKELTKEALDMLAELPGDSEFIKELFLMMTDRDY